jgi:hypothetical protein
MALTVINPNGSGHADALGALAARQQKGVVIE